MLQTSSAQAAGSRAVAVPPLVLPENGPTRERVQPAQPMKNFDGVRKNIRSYCRGIFKPPQAYRLPSKGVLCTDDSFAPPPRHIADHLLAQFRAVLHPFCPVFHWATFQKECDDLYRAGTFQGVRSIWRAVFCAVLACGTLVLDDRSGSEADGKAFIENAVRSVNSMSDEVTIDHARATLLISMYFMEQNLKSAGWIWLSAAVRTAQESALHCERGHGTLMEVEMQKRVWWSICNYDR